MIIFDTAAGAADFGSLLPVILIYVAFFVVIYFVAIRPSRKREKEAAKMQNELNTGDWVLLNSGMYGKVVSVLNDNLMVEFGTNRSIIIPVRRDQIAAKQEPNLSVNPVEEVAKKPEDSVVGDDIPDDQLDAYDQYILEKGDKKKKFGFKK